MIVIVSFDPEHIGHASFRTLPTVTYDVPCCRLRVDQIAPERFDLQVHLTGTTVNLPVHYHNG